jgi:hypothetical protein
MREFASPDRCAAYVAARAALIVVQRVAAHWPESLADRARRAASDALQLTAAAIAHDHASAGRRHCLREAITSALRVAATVDLARAIGPRSEELADVQRIAGRSVALLAMFLHASTSALSAVP